MPILDFSGTPIRTAPRQHNVQMAQKIYFWHNPKTEHIMSGAPPQFDSMKPPGYLTIECAHAHEVETWSKRLNEQQKRIEEMTDLERWETEKPMIANLRAELKDKIFNARNGINKMLLEKAMDELNKYEKTQTTKYESFMHVEAYEQGK